MALLGEGKDGVRSEREPRSVRAAALALAVGVPAASESRALYVLLRWPSLWASLQRARAALYAPPPSLSPHRSISVSRPSE
jgi:hypothetical protein